MLSSARISQRLIRIHTQNQCQNYQKFFFKLKNSFSIFNKFNMSKDNKKLTEKIYDAYYLKANIFNCVENKNESQNQINKFNTFQNSLRIGIIYLRNNWFELFKWLGWIFTGLMYFRFADKQITLAHKQHQFETNENQIIRKYEDQQFQIPEYYDKNNSTHKQMKQIYDYLGGRYIFLMAGESGIGKTISLQSFITQRRNQIKQQKIYNEKIIYIALGPQQGVKFQQVQKLLAKIKRKCQKNRELLYTVFVDDISNIEKETEQDKYKFEDKMTSIRRYLIKNTRNIRICLITDSNLFKQKLRSLPNFRKYGYEQIQIIQKPLQEMKNCIEKIIKYQKNQISQDLSENQKQAVQYFLKQGHNLRTIELWISMIFKLRMRLNLTQEVKKNSDLNTQQKNVISAVKQFEKRKSQDYNRMIFEQSTEKFDSQFILKILAKEQNKKKQCHQIKKIIVEEIKQKNNQKNKRIANIASGQKFLETLEEQTLLFKCYPRSEFIRKYFEEYKS